MSTFAAAAAIAAAAVVDATASALEDDRVFPITAYGAVGDNSTINTAAIQRAIAAASSAGGGHVTIPEGVFKTGTVNLTSGVYMSFAPGAYLQGSWDPADYGWDWDYWHIVQAVNATNTGLVGAGLGAGSGGIVGIMWQQSSGGGPDPASHMLVPRPWTGVHGCVGECRVKNAAFIDCAGVVLSGVELLLSSDWTLLLRRTSGVLLENLYIRNSVDWPNGDGLDVESGRNITMRGLDITTGDDCIALRSGNCNDMRTPWPQPADAIDPLVDVFISNCTLRSSSAAVKIEALFQQAHGNISNVVVEDVTILPGTNRGVGIWQRVGSPTRRDGGGWIRDVVVRNVVATTAFMYSSNWWGSGEPLVITTVPETAAQAAIGLPGIHNVTVENFAAVSEQGALISARDQETTNPGGGVTGLVLRNVSLTITRFQASAGDWVSPNATWAVHDYRPVDAGAPSPNTVPALVDGVYFEHVGGALLDGLAVSFDSAAPQPYWDGPAVAGAGGGNAGVCLNATEDSVIAVVGAAPQCSLATANAGRRRRRVV